MSNCRRTCKHYLSLEAVYLSTAKYFCMEHYHLSGMNVLVDHPLPCHSHCHFTEKSSSNETHQSSQKKNNPQTSPNNKSLFVTWQPQIHTCSYFLSTFSICFTHNETQWIKGKKKSKTLNRRKINKTRRVFRKHILLQGLCPVLQL